MPKKTTKRGREAALRQSHSTARFAAADGGPGPADPPIIITGGGSVAVYSKYKLDEVTSDRPGYIKYYTDKVTAKKIKAMGRGPAGFDDDCDMGVFEMKVLDS